MKIPGWLKTAAVWTGREALHYGGLVARSEFEAWLKRRNERVEVVREVPR